MWHTPGAAAAEAPRLALGGRGGQVAAGQGLRCAAAPPAALLAPAAGAGAVKHQLCRGGAEMT